MSLEQRVHDSLALHPGDKKLKLLASGYQDAWNACSRERSAANLKGLETWEGKLLDYLDALPTAPGQGPRELPDPLQNLHQVWQYLRELGYSCSKAQPARAVRENKLSARKGGGFTQAEVRRYASTHKLKRLPSADSPADDRPVLPGLEGAEATTGAAARKALSAARLMDANAELKEIEVRKARAEYVDILVVDREQTELCHAIRMHLSPMVRSTAERVLDLVGGERATAAQVVELVGGDPARVEDLLAWLAARKPDIVAMYKPYLRRALDVFARGEWLTAEMREAWALYQRHREEAELLTMRALIRDAGGDASKAEALLDSYYVRNLDN